MKIERFLFTVLMISIFSKPSFSQQHIEQRKIFVSYVEFNGFTNVRVSCSRFENDFARRIKSRKIDNIDTIQLLELYLKNARFKKDFEEIDARAKFIYQGSDGRRFEICISRFDVVVNGMMVKRNRKFLTFLKGLALAR